MSNLKYFVFTFEIVFACIFTLNYGDKLDLVYLLPFLIIGIVAIQLIFSCFENDPKTEKEKEFFGLPCPEKDSSFISKILYLWFDSMVFKGWKEPLSNADLWDLNEVDKAESQVPLFYKHWDKAVEKAKKKSIKSGKKVEASAVWTLNKLYGATVFAGGFMKLLQELLAFMTPYILSLLVKFTSPKSKEEWWKGYIYAGILLGTSFLQTLIGVQYVKLMYLVGMRTRTCLSSAVYRKSLLTSTSAKKESSVGEIVNLMSVDTQRLMDLTVFFHYIWISPLILAVSTYFLYNILGACAFAGLAVMVLLIPINGFIASKVRELHMQQMSMKDNRVKLMSELLSGMKVLKLYGWEPSFEEEILKIRKREMRLLRKAAFWNSSQKIISNIAPFLVGLSTFGTYVLWSDLNNLDAETAFVSLTLFNIMKLPIIMFPVVFGLITQASVSAQRLNKFMNAEEIDPDVVSHDKSGEAVVVKGATFSWTHDDLTLKDIHFNANKGSLVAIVGKVGSGKTSILSALLGNLKKHSGTVNLCGSTAYVAQSSWIQNASLRKNILFKDSFNETKYRNVIEACALEEDLLILPEGDETEIGEKGINLSGGQKQRVALARAAYKECDVYLLDDPLSAVDSHVGKHIFDNLIGPEGMLKTKTRILVTHSVAFLPQVDQIYVLKNGKISESGTFDELLQKKGNFSEFLMEHLVKENEPIDDSLIKEIKGIVGVETSITNSSKILQGISVKNFRPNKKGIKSELKGGEKRQKLIQDERSETGNVSFDVYLDYLKAAGIKLFIFALTFVTLTQATSAYSSIWLSNWVDQGTIDKNATGGYQVKSTRDYYLKIYGGVGVVQVITICIGTISLAMATLNSAESIHFEMLSRIMKAPMSYFETTPSGRLVNRFAKDVDTTDILLPQIIGNFIEFALNFAFPIIVISYSTPWFLIFIVPCLILYGFVQRFYVATSRQLKRIESVSRSPIYSKFSETISGDNTIRAFGLEDDFVGECEKKIDYNQRAHYAFIISDLWIAIRLESIGSLIIFAAAIFAVVERGRISQSIVGLSIAYALQVPLMLNLLVKFTTNLESNIIAVERMKELSGSTPQEADWVTEVKPPKDWPQKGAVVFDNYETRYRDGLDLVLKGINCSIKPGEKVGIVGRTGAGKSSLTLALFRIIEPVGGTIFIDGIDITKIGLHDLRSKITIIPQDPVLFSGNLRINLDPFNIYTDDQVWKSLESAHLKPFVSSLPGGLLSKVAEEGQNFSVGQRQLVCLARALLRKTKILVLDEATAAVDLETDDLIQKTIKVEFKDSTVITIAHRLNTIMDSNRVIVVDQGQIVEFEPPEKLLLNSHSIFYGMAKDAGLV